MDVRVKIKGMRQRGEGICRGEKWREDKVLVEGIKKRG